MEPGELELRKAFEETTTRNVNAAITHGNETRKIVRELEEKIRNFEKTLITKDNTINEMKKQIAYLQQKLYTGGSN